MIVNGSTKEPNKLVWKGHLTSALEVGKTYEFSAYVANVYPANPASLEFSHNGTQIGVTFSATGSGNWEKFTATFVATTADSPTAIDLNILASGNDFALDDMSLTVVPEPTTMIAGALLLLPFGASAMRFYRKSRTAA